MNSAVRRLRDVFADALLPPPALLVSEWARDRFRLSTDYSAVRGNFEPYAYQIEPLDLLSPSNPCEMVVLMCGAQMMKTLIMLIFLGYVIDIDPGPVLIVQPNREDADSFSKERLAPMIRDVPCVAEKVVEAKSRDTGNTIQQKRFRGGSVSLTGTVSPRGLRRRSVRYLLLDEVDGYSDTSDGDPISLAAARTSKFWNRKIVLCSTPTIEGRSRIALKYAESDQRRFHIPCPFCGEMQKLLWERVRWGQVSETRFIAPEDAHYQCVACEEFIPHYRKPEMLDRGRWVAENPEGRYPGLAISRLYAPDWSWGRIVTDPMEGWLAAKDDPARVQTFKNNILAETFKEPGEAPPDYEKLMGRQEGYRLGEVPDEVLFLTAGVDVQKTWLEGYVYGWGRGKQRWVIDHWRIEKNPYDPTAWTDLTEKLNQTYRKSGGQVLTIIRMGVDTGYESNQVYSWARMHGTSRVLAVDGRNFGPPVASPTMVDVAVNGRKIKHGCKLWGTNVSIWKSELYGYLNLPKPDSGPLPPGWVHFPADLPEEFYKQLTSEEFRLEVGRNGVRKYQWAPIQGRRHEALDCANYARACAYQFGSDRFSERRWAELEQQAGTYIAPVVVDHPTPIAQPTPAAPQVKSPLEAFHHPERDGGRFNRGGRWFR